MKVSSQYSALQVRDRFDNDDAPCPTEMSPAWLGAEPGTQIGLDARSRANPAGLVYSFLFNLEKRKEKKKHLCPPPTVKPQ